MSLIRPQAEHIRVDGKNRSTRATLRTLAALYSSMWVKLAQPASGLAHIADDESDDDGNTIVDGTACA